MWQLLRVFHIGLLLLFSGCFFGSRRQRGARLATLLQRLGPSYIKFGQSLSVRPDIIGEEAAEALAGLRDKLPPFSATTAKRIIEKELGKPLGELFTHFEDNPVAAASVAQVHKATTTHGHEVAVKIIRPRVQKAFRHDISLFYFMAKLLSKRKSLQRLKLMEVVATFEATVARELDLRLEAASATQLAENCKHDKHFRVPSIYWPLTSRKVLTLEWIDGIPIHDRNTLIQAGFKPEDIARKLAISFFNQSYRDGFFHADTHPGNLFVDSNGNLVPVDFGIMGQLDEDTRLYVAQILSGFLKGDYHYVADVHFEAGYVPANKSREDFAIACRAIGEPILGLSAKEVSIAKLLALLFKVTEDFEMETQPQLLLLQKTMVLVEGIGAHLSPEVNLWQLAENWIQDWGKANISPQALAKRKVKGLAKQAASLPETLAHLQSWIAYTHQHGLKLDEGTIAALRRKPVSHAAYWFLLGVLSAVVGSISYLWIG